MLGQRVTGRGCLFVIATCALCKQRHVHNICCSASGMPAFFVFLM